MQGGTDRHDAAQTVFVYKTLQQLHERLLTVEGTVQQLATHHAHKLQQGASPDTFAVAAPIAAATEPAAVPILTLTLAAAETESAAAAAAAAADEAAPSASDPSQTAAQLKTSTHDLESLEDSFDSFHSATRWLSCTSNSSGLILDASSHQHTEDAAASARTIGGAEAAGPDAAAVSPAPAGAALDASLAGGIPANPAPASLSHIQAQLAPPATQPADAAAAPAALAAAKSAVWSSRHTSTTQVETQLTALQQEVDVCQLQAMQSALKVLDSKLQQLQQQQAVQCQLLDSQKVSTGTNLPLPMPLEPRVDQLTGQLGTLAAQVEALRDLVAQQPARFDVLQLEIEQLSHQLAEVNEAAAEEADVQLLREKLEALQQQHSQLSTDLATDIQAATEAAAAAAAVASAAAEAAAGVEASTQRQLAGQQEKQNQWQQLAAETILQRLAAVESSLQQLGTVQVGLSQLQQQVSQHMDDAREQAAIAAASSAEQNGIMEALAASAAEFAGKLVALEVSVGDKVSAAVASATEQAAADTAAVEAKLQQQQQALQAALAEGSGASAEEVAGKLQALQKTLDSKVAVVEAALSAATQQAGDSTAKLDAKLDQHDNTLRAAFKAAQEVHDADLKQQLKEQVDTMAQILADVGSYKAEQAAVAQHLQGQLQGLKEVQDSTLSNHSTQLEHLTGKDWQVASILCHHEVQFFC
jgi:regulator of replication initiation timing